MARSHEPTPVIVPRDAYDAWPDPRLPLAEAAAMLGPYAPEAMYAYAVTRWVNDPRYDDAHALEPAPEIEA